MVIVFYISGHGFGHASRDVELMRTLGARAPGIRFVVRTIAPTRLFEDVAGPEDPRNREAIVVQPAQVDTGIAQIDSLRIDEPDTARQVAAFYQDFDRKVNEEAALVRGVRASLVLGDIPPLAFAAAAQAGVPSVAVANFTWDWIYSIYPDIGRLSPRAIPIMREAYGQTTLALRLPLHGGFEPMEAVTRDIPFIARRSTRDPKSTRQLLGLPNGRPVVLASFGGAGLALPAQINGDGTRLTVLRGDAVDLRKHGLRYEDLVAVADVVVSKPGYGIVSECAANGAALLYTSRGRFIEYDVFVSEMPGVLRCRYLSQQDLLAGRWADAVEALLAQPAVERPRVDGADIAADLILALSRA